MVKLVCKKELDSGACVVRPPSHHCEKENAMGFCIL